MERCKNLGSYPARNRIPPLFMLLPMGSHKTKFIQDCCPSVPPLPLAPLGTPLFNIEKAEISHIKKPWASKKFAPPGKSTQTALQNIEKGKISHIKKPEASKEVRPSWKKHQKGRYHMRIVDPFCNKSHPKE